MASTIEQSRDWKMAKMKRNVRRRKKQKKTQTNRALGKSHQGKTNEGGGQAGRG